MERSRSILTRSMSRSNSSRATAEPTPKTKPKPKPKQKPSAKRGRTSKNPDTAKDKLYLVPGSGGALYTHLNPEEYAACQKEYKEKLSNHHRKKASDYAKRQSDFLCCKYFPIIQETSKEMADLELVEPIAVMTILAAGCWAHMNFKAKHKGARDSSIAMYFAELDVASKEVTCLTKLDIDHSADTVAYKSCVYCHGDFEVAKDLRVAGYGCVYHPIDKKLFLC